MSRLISLLRIPRWLAKTWDDTVVAVDQPASDLPDPREAETVPLPLYGGLVSGQ